MGRPSVPTHPEGAWAREVGARRADQRPGEGRIASPREPGRRGPTVASSGEQWLGSGPGLGRTATRPGMNYSCPVPSKLFQFYIFKYLIIRHQIFMQFY